ncbi:MAG: FAD-binding oxidoreductase, partial [Myxococcota bacterium]|nr:FAD-binding oxidoreductase [Myxococcota bacterium]
MTGGLVRPVGTLDELQRIVPTEQIDSSPESGRGQQNSFAVEPATKEELIDILRWANAAPAGVYTRLPRDRDRKVCGKRPRLYLKGRRMARVRDLDVMSGTVTVQSGITMLELQRILEERGYTTGFPGRAWADESVGSVLAASLDAHWGPPYGTMEREVVSLGVVLPDGTAAASRIAPRGAVGPDFDRVFLGSRGRYGIIHEVTLRILPASARTTVNFAAANLGEALQALRAGFRKGLDCRNAEILTPTPDRSWGSKRLGLGTQRPLLVLVEPWGRQSGMAAEHVDEVLGSTLERLEPPVGWNTHEGLLPPPRRWREPVVAIPWRDLSKLANELGNEVPPGLWIVRLSRHGAWVSVADNMPGAPADVVRKLIQSRLPPKRSPWSKVATTLKAQLDPRNVLNPS